MSSRLVNILRYALSIVMLCMSTYNPLVFAGCAVFLLLANNFLDDFMFYYGNLSVRFNSNKRGVISPVNGVVTMVEKNVPLYSSIRKVDPLTQEKLLSIDLVPKKVKSGYSHIAIFLNKLNHHIVVNPAECKAAYIHMSGRQNLEMVDVGDLVGKNTDYLLNDAVILKYPTFIVVVTLDKYVSEYIPASYKAFAPRMIICRGSQCDIFFRDNRDIIKNVGDLVMIGDEIAVPFIEEHARINPADLSIIPGLVQEAVKLHDGGILGLFLANVRKTLDTFCNPIIAVSCLVGVGSYFLSHVVSYVAFSSVILFVLVRWYRNIMYCLMNYVGLKPWMEKSYSAISKLSVIWQIRKKNWR